MDLFLSHIFFSKNPGISFMFRIFLKCKNSGNIHLGIGYSIGILKFFKVPMLFIPVFL